MSASFEMSFVLGMQRLVFASAWMPGVAVFCARWLIFVNIFLIGMLLRSSSRHRHVVSEAVWSLCVALLLTSSIGFFVQRARPFLVSDAIIRLIPIPLNTSFPSGHTAAAIAIASAVFFGNRLLGWISFVIAFGVILGRIAVGVHYPSDVLGGMLVGVVSFFLIRYGHRQIRRRDLAESVRRHHHEV